MDAPDRFAPLLDRYLDGLATPGELAELQGWLERDAGCRRTLVERMRIGIATRDLFAAQAVAPVAILAGPARRWRWRVAALAAAAACLALVLVRWPTRSAADDIRVKLATGGATLHRGGTTAPAVVGAALVAADAVEVPAGAAVTIAYADGTAVAVAGGSRLRVAEVDPIQRGKSLLLETGSLTAEVAKQPAGEPMRFATPNAVAIVVGTRLVLTATATTSRLEVVEGRVSFARVGDVVSAVLVVAGEHAQFAADDRASVAAPALVGETRPRDLAPANGCLLGVSARIDEGGPAAVEAAIGRRVAIAHQYHAFSDTGRDREFPTAIERGWAADGRLLMLSWKPRLGSTALTWADVAAGRYDERFVDPTARKLADWGQPCFLALHHQPDDEVGPVGSGMTAADYVAMWRHVHARFAAAGATKVVWVWTVVAGTADPALWRALYPGDDVVDWLACGAFNHQPGPWRSLSEATAAFRAWATATKPIMFNVISCAENPQGSPSKGDWFRGLPDELRSMPAVKAVIYWNGQPGPDRGSYPFTSSPDAAAGFRTFCQDPYLAPR